MEAVQPTSTAAEVAPAIAGNVTSAEVPVVDKQNDQPEEAAVNAGENTEIQHAEPPSSDPQQAAPQPQETADGKNPQQEPEAPPAPAMPSDDAVVSRLRELLKEVDLGVTTEKMLRRQLESHFGVGLTEKKTLLRTEIEAYLQSHNAPEEGGAEDEGEEEEEDGSEEEDEEDDGDAAPVKKRSRGGATRFGDVLSEPMSAFLGMERCPRTQVVKKMWEYIKANNLQDPKDKRRVLLDDKMKTIFPGKSINMFTMQKHLSKHVFIDDSVESEEDSDGGEEEERPKKKPAAKRAPATKSPGTAAKPNGFTKPVRLSPELAAWMGTEAAPRPQITKFLWEYVKAKGLQDPSNKQFVLADETLRKLTGEERFKAFSFSKLIKDHVLGYAD